MNKFVLFIGLIVIGATAFFIPLSLAKKSSPKIVTTMVQQGEKVVESPKFVKFIKLVFDSILDYGDKILSLISTGIGLGGLTHHTVKTRKRKAAEKKNAISIEKKPRKTVDKKIKM